MYGETRPYPQPAHLLVPLGVMVVGAVVAVLHHPMWWLLVAAFAGRAGYLAYRMYRRRTRLPATPGAKPADSATE